MFGPGIPGCESLQNEGWTEESGGVKQDHVNWIIKNESVVHIFNFPIS